MEYNSEEELLTVWPKMNNCCMSEKYFFPGKMLIKNYEAKTNTNRR